MINSLQNSYMPNNYMHKEHITDKSQTAQSPSFKGGFERLEEGIYRAGGINVWNRKTQRIISKSLGKEKLEEMIGLFEATENERILFCDIMRCGIFKRRLKAHFQCPYILNNFTEYFTQKPVIESKRNFLMRMLKQFDEYKEQLIKNGVKWK